MVFDSPVLGPDNRLRCLRKMVSSDEYMLLAEHLFLSKNGKANEFLGLIAWKKKRIDFNTEGN